MMSKPHTAQLSPRATPDARVIAWQTRHGDAWEAMCRAWEADGGTGLAFVNTSTTSAAPVVVAGETLAWLVGRAASDTQYAWLLSAACLIGEGIAYEAELDTMADELVDSYDQITFLYETARTLSGADTLADALRLVLAQARRIVGAAGSALIVTQPDAESLLLTDGVVPDTSLLMLAHETATRANHALVANTTTAACDALGAGGARLAVRNGVASLVVAPIQTAEGIASAACYGATKPGGFTAGNRRLMQAVVEQSITIVARFASQEEQIRRSRLARDLELAAQIQTAFLPAAFPGAAWVTLAARILPASEVGGDFYIHPDHDIPAGEPFMIGVGDVAGKGVAAALITTICLSALRAEMRHNASPATALRAMQGSVAGELDRIGSFVTCALATYHRDTRTLQYASAGHNPPLLWHAETGIIEELAATGLPIGIDIGINIGNETVLFSPTDVLLLYTDGVTEAMAADGALFGIARLRETLLRVASQSPTVIEETIIAAVQAFAPEQRDDITLVVLKAEG